MISLRSIRLCTLGFAFLGAHVAYAEGGCPPGSYPIGGQGCKAAPRFQVQGAEFRSRARRRPPRPFYKNLAASLYPRLRQLSVFRPASFRRRLLARARAECAAVSNPTEGMPHDAAIRGITSF